MNFQKKRLIGIIVLGATLVLGIAGLFTAWRLQQEEQITEEEAAAAGIKQNDWGMYCMDNTGGNHGEEYICMGDVHVPFCVPASTTILAYRKDLAEGQSCTYPELACTSNQIDYQEGSSNNYTSTVYGPHPEQGQWCRRCWIDEVDQHTDLKNDRDLDNDGNTDYDIPCITQAVNEGSWCGGTSFDNDNPGTLWDMNNKVPSTWDWSGCMTCEASTGEFVFNNDDETVTLTVSSSEFVDKDRFMTAEQYTNNTASMDIRIEIKEYSDAGKTQLIRTLTQTDLTSGQLEFAASTCEPRGWVPGQNNIGTILNALQGVNRRTEYHPLEIGGQNCNTADAVIKYTRAENAVAATYQVYGKDDLPYAVGGTTTPWITSTNCLGASTYNITPPEEGTMTCDEKTASVTTVTSGDTVTYTIDYSYANVTNEEFILIDSLNENFDSVNVTSGDCTETTGNETHPSQFNGENILVCTLDNTGTDSDQIVYTATVKDTFTGDLENRAYVYEKIDNEWTLVGNSEGNSCLETITVVEEDLPSAGCTSKAVSKALVDPNDQITFTITFFNGDVASSEDSPLTITDTLPNGITYQSYALSNSAFGTCTVSGKTITCTLDNVPANTTNAKLTVSATVDSDVTRGAEITNTATVTIEEDSSTNDDSCSTDLTTTTPETPITPEVQPSTGVSSTAIYMSIIAGILLTGGFLAYKTELGVSVIEGIGNIGIGRKKDNTKVEIDQKLSKFEKKVIKKKEKLLD